MSGYTFPFMAKLKRYSPNQTPEEFLYKQMEQNLKAIEEALKVRRDTVTEITNNSALNYAISANRNNFSTTSTSYVDVPGASVTITTVLNPVMIQIVPNNDGLESQINAVNTTDFSLIQCVRDAQPIGRSYINFNPPLVWFDAAGPGVKTYKIQILSGSGAQVNANKFRLLAREL